MLCGKPLYIGVIVLLAQSVFVGPAWAEVQEETQVALDITANQNWVSGPGAAQSTLSVDRHFSSDFSYSYQRTDGYKISTFSFHGRGTDDRSIDSQTWSLSNLDYGWSDKSRRFTLGDVMADFSTYSLSGSLKGASFNFNPSSSQSGQIRKPEINLVYGVSYPRWENFWGGADHKAIKRMVSGVNLRQSISDKADFGVSVVRTGDSPRLANWDELLHNNVYSFNWELRPQERITFKGESAFSNTTKSPSQGVTDEHSTGRAHHFSFNKESHRRKWSYEYELVTPNFNSPLGSAITDQERMKFNWTSTMSPDFSMNAGIAWYRNKLDGSSQPYRTDMYQPELTFSFTAPFAREDATLDFGMRLDRRYGGGISTFDRLLTAAYRDTFGKVDADISLDYAIADTAPYDYGIKNKDLAFNITLGTSIKNKTYILNPTLNVSYTRNSDVLNHYRDRMFEAALGMGYERPQDNLSINLKVGRNQNLRQVTPDSGKWFTSLRVEAQPKYLKMFNQNAKQYLEVNVNTYKFDDTGNNYRETSLITGVRLEFS